MSSFIAHLPFPRSQFPTGVFWDPLSSELLVLKSEFQSGFCRNPNADPTQSCARWWGNMKMCSLCRAPGPGEGRKYRVQVGMVHALWRGGRGAKGMQGGLALPLGRTGACVSQIRREEERGTRSFLPWKGGSAVPLGLQEGCVWEQAELRSQKADGGEQWGLSTRTWVRRAGPRCWGGAGRRSGY